MYYQEIVISPDIFQKIYEAFLPNAEFDIDLKSYKDNLNNKKLILDKNGSEDSILFEHYKSLKEKANDVGKIRIDSILKGFLSNSDKIKYALNPFNKELSKNKLHNILLNLGILTESKIINAEDSSIYFNKIGREELNEIEVLDIENFIYPKELSRVFSLKKEIKIEHLHEFKFEKYFEPYICSAKNILINDRYLRGYGALQNLKIIIGLCKELESLTIQTIMRNNPADNFDVPVETLEEEINNISPVNCTIKPSPEHLRFIKTEDYKIDIDPGFNFVDDKYEAVYSSVAIKFAKI